MKFTHVCLNFCLSGLEKLTYIYVQAESRPNMEFYGTLITYLFLKANKHTSSVPFPQPLKSTFSFII